jgi:predicted DNA-binding transcriptional regulator AlpA
MSPDAPDPILSEQEYVAWVNTSRSTAQRQRLDGSGPEFIQLSERRIGYRKSAVEAWLLARTVNRVGQFNARTGSPNAPVLLERVSAAAESGGAA